MRKKAAARAPRGRSGGKLAHKRSGGARRGKARLGSDPYRKPSDIVSGGFLHPLILQLRIQRTLACFCRRLRQSAIMAMNSEFVGLPLMFETV